MDQACVQAAEKPLKRTFQPRRLRPKPRLVYFQFFGGLCDVVTNELECVVDMQVLDAAIAWPRRRDRWEISEVLGIHRVAKASDEGGVRRFLPADVKAHGRARRAAPKEDQIGSSQSEFAFLIEQFEIKGAVINLNVLIWTLGKRLLPVNPMNLVRVVRPLPVVVTRVLVELFAASLERAETGNPDLIQLLLRENPAILPLVSLDRRHNFGVGQVGCHIGLEPPPQAPLDGNLSNVVDGRLAIALEMVTRDKCRTAMNLF